MPRQRVLQLFSRYLQYGGEEGSVFRIGETMQDHFDVEYFIASSETLLKSNRLMVPVKAYRNRDVLRRLEKYQKIGRFNFWQIHNVFPAISAGAYGLARDLGVPIVHYLHNYRMGCVNGYLFTKGGECRKCISGNFSHGALGACWRGSHLQSGMMALLLTDVRGRKFLDSIAQWIAISEAQKKEHLAFGIPAEKIAVVPHFLEYKGNQSVPDFPSDGYGLFIGRISPEKGVDRLLAAWGGLPKSRKLVIAGEGPELPKLKEQARKLGLDNVRFAGFIPKEQQQDLWKGAAFSIVPSIWQEPFGMVVLEAWAKERPVVAHSIGALPEIITHGTDGFLADPYIPGSLTAALSEAFQSSARLREMGIAGREQLQGKYNKEIWLRSIRSVYKHLTPHEYSIER